MTGMNCELLNSYQ